MIFGTGIDIVEVDRIEAKVSKDNGFREKVFSADEILFCESKANKAEMYAARFAAKEAFLKAIGQGLLAGFELHEIEVINEESGKPKIKLNGAFDKLARDNGWHKIHVSLSHIKSTACAVVIIEQ